MVDTTFKGPVIGAGSLLVESGTTAQIGPMDGPSGFYQGNTLLDPRSVPYPSEGTTPGRSAAFLNNGAYWVVDRIPQAAATNVIATAAVATANTAITLVSTQAAGAVAGTPSIAPGIPILPQGTSTIINVLAIDFGFSTGTTTANSSTVAVYDNTKFSVGQWVLIGGGGSGNTSSFFTQVQTISTSNYTGITVSPAVPGALANAPIGQSNIFAAGYYPPPTQFGPSAVTPTYHIPDMLAGVLRVHNPAEQLARNISISLVTGGVATAVNFLIQGWDVWKQQMTELITVPATTSATTAYGQKAFKYISSITPTSASTGGNTYAVGIGDTFGFPFRADEWEQTLVMWAGTTNVNSTGFTAAATTQPATNTTGDVRGTLQVSTDGKGTAITGALVTNGTSRLAMMQNVGVWNVIAATPNNPVPLFGVTNSTT